jgi:methylglutaconyl-CoA hydratase
MTIPSTAETTGAGTVAVDVSDGIATIRFAHPKGNSLPGTLLRRLAAEIDAIGLDERARVVVLRSEGLGPFCAGASFEELVSIDDQATGHEFFMGFARLILSMKRCPKLIVARVHGKAVGGGVGVAAAADYSLASSFASIKLSELAVGIGPFVVGPVIEKKIGSGPFGALAIDADWRDANWAERHGLYAAVHPSVEELDLAVEAIARRLAASNPEATAGIKKVMWAGTEHWDRLLPERAAMSGALVLSDFTRQAIAAFQSR